MESSLDQEWLEADGLGGFASGTALLARTRRYHALLLSATSPPTGRMVLVNGLDAWIETPEGTFPISSQRYAPGVTHPDGASRLESFEVDPWPRWGFRLANGIRVTQEIFVPRGAAQVVISWKIGRRLPGMTLFVRPFLSGRDAHALHRANPAFRFDATERPGRVAWRPYADVPGVIAFTDGAYRHSPEWYRDFIYEEDLARGLDHLEDLASPGIFRFDLSRGEGVLLLAAEGIDSSPAPDIAEARASVRRLRTSERRRRARFPGRLERSADSYLVARGSGRTIIAGYPWFTDWGRDTFIALRGLCLATGRTAEAQAILLEWAGAVSEGMLPNRFPEAGSEPEFNSVDASLWYVVAAHEFLRALEVRGRRVRARHRARLLDAVDSILTGYAAGTRYGIQMDDDGLLAAGVPGSQLTWMDARVGDRVATPRVGKPVEVQALWINALCFGASHASRWRDLHDRARRAFEARFWDAEGGFLYDVVDVDHLPGVCDSSFRPNQILAVGGLPYAVLEGPRARRVVDQVESRLLTPLGLRSLASDAPDYRPRYEGGVRDRDSAYHQGTVWPWLLGPFVEAWVRVRASTGEAKEEARDRFLGPVWRHLNEAGLGHVSEIADGQWPHTPRGCPFQAWSVGEVLRLSRGVLAPAVQVHG